MAVDADDQPVEADDGVQLQVLQSPRTDATPSFFYTINSFKLKFNSIQFNV